MPSRIERTLVPGKTVRQPPEPLQRVLLAEAQPDEVVVSLLETASDHQLRAGSSRVWVALTDRRALTMAAAAVDDSWVDVVDPATVVHRGRLGRDEISAGDHTLKCPLLRGGTEFKLLAQLAEASPVERLRVAAEQRLEENAPDAAAALAEAGLEHGPDPNLLSLRVLALLADERIGELGPAFVELLRGDPQLSSWKELVQAINGRGRVLWMLYQAAQEEGLAPAIRARLANLRALKPNDGLTAELAITMDVDEGQLEAGLARAMKWHEEGAVSDETFLSTCTLLSQAGLETELLYRQRALTLGQLEKFDDALRATEKGLALEESSELLRLQADLLGRLGRTAEAVVPLENLLQRGAADAWTCSRLGAGYEAQGRFDEAIDVREQALEKRTEIESEPEPADAERRALARLHRARAQFLTGEEQELRLAFADLLDRGLDWAARLIDPPELVLAGTSIRAQIEVLAARPAQSGPALAGLFFEETVREGKNGPPAVPAPPPLLAGGVAGRWPTVERESDVVHSDKKGAQARYPLGPQTSIDLPEGLPRGLHRVSLSLPVPPDVRPSYQGERVESKLLLELTPPGASFRIAVGTCHAPQDLQQPPAEASDQAGRYPLAVTIPSPAWILGDTACLEVSARISGERQPSRVDVSLTATESLRPPHKGERVVESWTWTIPVFPYELDQGTINRRIHLDLPRLAPPTAGWNWFELRWEAHVSLVRKERPEASVKLPILLRYRAPEPGSGAEKT